MRLNTLGFLDSYSSSSLLSPGLYLITGPLAAGLILDESKWVILSAAEIFGHSLSQHSKSITSSTSSPSNQSPFIRSLRDLDEGDYIVHVDYGIGIYRGFEQIKTSKDQIDCMCIEFAKNEILHLPIYRLHLIQKFVASSHTQPKLNGTQSKKWSIAKAKAKEEALEQADALLQIYAQREATQGYAYSEPKRAFAEFEARFAHKETRDQEKSIRKPSRNFGIIEKYIT